MFCFPDLSENFPRNLVIYDNIILCCTRQAQKNRLADRYDLGSYVVSVHFRLLFDSS